MNGCRDVLQRFANHLAVIAARLVIVGNDADIGAREMLVQLRRPLAGASRIAGGDEAELGQIVDVLLAFDDIDRLLLGDSLQHLRQPERHLRDTVQLLVQPPLPFGLRWLKPFGS